MKENQINIRSPHSHLRIGFKNRLCSSSGSKISGMKRKEMKRKEKKRKEMKRIKNELLNIL
jgi:hypothetical protein